MLSSVMSLALAMAPMCSLAPRFSVFRPAASFAPTLATHGGMATGMHGYMERESAQPGADISCRADVQHTRQLSSKPYLETTCCGASPGACPEPGLPRVHVGRSTKGLVGRTPLVRLPSSYGPVRGRGLTSCCMRAGDLEPYDGLVLPQLPKRPRGARYLLSRSDAGTLIVTLPPLGVKAGISSSIGSWLLDDDFGFRLIYCWLLFSSLGLCVLSNPGITSVPAQLVQPLLDAANAPVDSDVAVNAILGCASASWLAARAFTTTTLSVGEFQWEYKETIAGMIPTCYRQGSVQELDICLQETSRNRGRSGDKQLKLITGLETICIGGNSRVSEEEIAWVFDSVERQIAAINWQESLPAAFKGGFLLSLQSTIGNMLSK